VARTSLSRSAGSPPASSTTPQLRAWRRRRLLGQEAFLAFLQADTVAEHIAAGAGEQAFGKSIDPVSMCIMEMFDKATFRRGPAPADRRSRATSQRPPRRRRRLQGRHRRDVALGEKMLGATVPMRSHAGEPFDAGFGLQEMEVGLKGMFAVLAE
jgi:sulfide:quinone oxidoreductase